VRAGAHALSLLAIPLNVQVLHALAEEPMPLVDLRRAVGSPPQTTMRGHLRALTDIGVLERRRQNDFPGTVDYELSGPGRELLGVAGVLDSWLADSPEGAISLGNGAAKGAIKALVEGWSSTIVRALAARPLSLTELNRLISGLNYPSLERRLGALRLAGQIEACPGEGRSTPYAVTDWLRRAIAPLAVAARWERRHIPTASPIARIDVEATFLLAVPVLGLPTEMSGSCRLAVELRNGRGDPHLAGVLVEVREGNIVSCVARLQGEADAWVWGSISTWLQAVIEADTDRFEIGGDCDLAAALFEALHGTLFGIKQES
jgi:DNA-binding HxlR family transcriptional regulator